MMIDIKTVIQIVSFLIVAGGLFSGFVKMQTTQNMKIENLDKELEELKRKQSLATSHQIETEKTLIEIGKDIKQILKDIEGIKEHGCSKRVESHGNI
jgi:septal ring factor EnvC (AmiA/AmiB activator)